MASVAQPAAEPAPPARRFRRLRPAAALVLAAGSAAIGGVGLLPPAWWWLLAVHIAATEGSPWLILAAGVAIALAAPPRGSWRWRGTAIAGALLAVALAAPPLLALPATIAASRRAMASAFGERWLDDIPAAALRSPLRRPFAWSDALCGHRSPPVEILRDVLATSAGDARLHATLYLPPDDGALHPVVVALHGGGWRGGSTAEGESAHRHLAADGFLIVSLDYRSAPRFPFPAALDDVRAGIAWTVANAARYRGDSRRLALIGRSAGAQLAMLAAYAEAAAPVRAVVTWYGPIDLVEGYRVLPDPDPLDVRALLRDYLGGTPEERPATYRDASPIAYADRDRPPTLIIAGARDHAVLIGYEREMAARLAAHGTPAALIELPWAEHAFDRIPDGPGGQLALFWVERFLAWSLRP